MELAIPDHLKTARTRHTRYGDDYTPPYPGFVARHKPTVSSVVMAYFGLQFRPADEAASAAALARLDKRASAQTTVRAIGTAPAIPTRRVTRRS